MKTKQTIYKPVTSVEVRIWGNRAGAVALEPKLGYYSFEYDPKFLAKKIELAPLSMPLSQAEEPFIFTNLPEATYHRLPALLADSLPDSFGNALIDAWMANKGLAKSQITTLDRLAYMGRRGMGALEFKPARGPHAASTSALKMGALVNQARIALHGGFDGDDQTQAALAQIISVGTSAGGARAKATIAWNPQSNEVRAGQLDIPSGFEAWLLKFDGVGKDGALGVTKDYGRIEYAYANMARAAGITMSNCRLLEENGRAHFMTQRFDREGNARHHMQTLCAMSHLDYKQRATHSYNQLFETVQQLNLGRDAMVEVLRRMVFNLMASNCDDHTKNHSFMLKENDVWALAPAYDVTFAFEPGNQWIEQHLMSVEGVFFGVTRRHIKTIADRFGVAGHVSEVLEQVSAAIARWDVFSKEAGVDVIESKRIAEQLALSRIS